MKSDNYYQGALREMEAETAFKKMPVIWASPLENCNCCNRDFFGTMYDARLPFGWGNYCGPCFKRNGGRLGTGLGQRYELQELPNDTSRKAWIKTGG